MKKNFKIQLVRFQEALVEHDPAYFTNKSFSKLFKIDHPQLITDMDLLKEKKESQIYMKFLLHVVSSPTYVREAQNMLNRRSECLIICGIDLKLTPGTFESQILSISCHDFCLGNSFARTKFTLAKCLQRQNQHSSSFLFLRSLNVFENIFHGEKFEEIAKTFRKPALKNYNYYGFDFTTQVSIIITDTKFKDSKILNACFRVLDLLSVKNFKSTAPMSFLSSQEVTLGLSEAIYENNAKCSTESINACVTKRFQIVHENFVAWNLFEVNVLFKSQDVDKVTLEKKIIHQYRQNIQKSEICTSQTWTDVGGLDSIKIALKRILKLSIKYRKLFPRKSLQRNGILLYGPPGTGKTLLARVIASEFSLHFINVKGPEIIDMYIGESERHVREIFEQAKKYRPSVIFFDELDALAPSRPYSSRILSSSTRVVSQFLTEIDELVRYDDIFILGATNRPDLIEPSLFRPGRFETPIFVGIDSTLDGRQKLLEALTKGFKFDVQFSLHHLSKRVSELFTGADMYAVCISAWLRAAKRTCMSFGKNQEIQVKQDDFIAALQDHSPSLRKEDIRRYEVMEKSFT